MGAKDTPQADECIIDEQYFPYPVGSKLRLELGLGLIIGKGS